MKREERDREMERRKKGNGDKRLEATREIMENIRELVVKMKRMTEEIKKNKKSEEGLKELRELREEMTKKE